MLTVMTLALLAIPGARAATSSVPTPLTPPTSNSSTFSASLAPPPADYDAPDFCPGTVLSSSSSLIVVAQATSGQVIAKAVGMNGKGSGWEQASSASGTTLRGGPAAVLLPHGLGIFIAVCDGAGALRGTLLRPPAEDGSMGLVWGSWHTLGAGAAVDCGTTPTLVADERSLLHIFAVGARDGELWHGTWITTPQRDVHSIVEQKQGKAREPAGTAEGAPAEEADVDTARTTQRAAGAEDAEALLFTPSSDGSLLAWTALSARVTASPVATLDSVGDLHLVGRGASGQLFHRSATCGRRGIAAAGCEWSTRWHALDGRVRGSPRLPLRRHAMQLLELLGRGRADSAAYRLAQTPLRPPREVSWGRRQPLGGVLASAPTAAEDSTGRMHVFGLGPDGTAWHRALSAPDSASAPRPLSQSQQLGVSMSSSHWSSLGGELDTAPVAAVRSDGSVAVIARGADGALYLKSQNAAADDTWAEWQSVGGPVRAFAC